MATPRDQEIDSLSDLEDRITRTVELVSTLKQERDQARAEAQAASGRADELAREIEELRSERKQVRSRIEKLLGQMDLLSA